MSDRCPTCDRDKCPTLIPYAERGGMTWSEAEADCWAHRVDWRALFHAARAAAIQMERERDEEAESATRAEQLADALAAALGRCQPPPNAADRMEVFRARQEALAQHAAARRGTL